MSNIRIPLAAALTLSLCTLALPVRADDNEEGNKRGEDQGAYLALGDSVPFGYNPLIAVDLNNYVGFPKIVGQLTETTVTNASCPYETTDSFMMANGCPWLLIPQHRLFVNYGNRSQLAFAVQFLHSHKVKLVTLMIGGNDLAQIRTCSTLDCETNVFTTVTKNLYKIYATIRAEYKGPIVAVNYYSFDYSNDTVNKVFMALNGVIAGVSAPFGVKVADGFGAFQAASVTSKGSPCIAGLLIPHGDGTCDIHPSPYGQTILAGAVTAVIENKDHE